MNIYIVQGGIGKHVMFSSLIEKLAEEDEDKIIIVSAYPDLFKYHPMVEVSANFHEPGFYDKYVKGTDNNVIYREPYFSNYVKGETHFIQNLAEILGVEYDNDLPDMYVDNFAVEESQRFVENFPNFIVTQFSGGQSPINFDPNRPFMQMGQIKDYPRDLAQDVVNTIKKEYPEYKILNYALPNEATYNLENTIHIESPYLFYVSLLNYCKTYISIDSSLQHFAANRYNKNQGIVLWGSTDSKCLGYQKNVNITMTGEHTMRPLCNTIGDVFNEDKSPWKHPDPECMKFDPSLVLDPLENCIKNNEKLSNEKLINVVKNENMIDINEKTQQVLKRIEAEVGRLNEKYQSVIETYIAAMDKDGQYRVSSDGKRLIKT
jgi:hypothetical protein